MWSMLTIIVFGCLKVVIGSDHHWRDYDGTIPHDALVDKDTGLAIVQMYVQRYSGTYPTGANGCCGVAEVKYGSETITKDIKVLCVENPERYYWEWAYGANVTSTSDHRGLLVKGGTTKHGRAVFIAKIFIRGQWHLGEVEDGQCKFYNIANCYHYVSWHNWCVSQDCMVLKYRNIRQPKYII